MSAHPVSTVPAAITYLNTAIEAQTSTDALPILVAIGDDPTLYQPNDVILIGAVRRTPKVDTFIGSGGQFWLNEEYEIEIVVSSWSGDNDGPASMNRAWQLVGYIEFAVRLDPSLGNLVNLAYPSLTESVGPFFVSSPNEGMSTEVTVTVTVENLN